MADKIKIEVKSEGDDSEPKFSLNIPLESFKTLRAVLGDEGAEQAKASGMDIDGWIKRMQGVEPQVLFEMKAEQDRFTVEFE